MYTIVFENGTHLEIVLFRMLEKHNKAKVVKSISTYVPCTRTIMAIKENHSIRVKINSYVRIEYIISVKSILGEINGDQQQH